MLFWYFPGMTEWNNKQLSGQSFSKSWSTTDILWTQTSSNSQWHTQNLFVYLFIYLSSVCYKHGTWKSQTKHKDRKEINIHQHFYKNYIQSTNLQESLFNCTSAINYENMNYLINYEERVCLFVCLFLVRQPPVGQGLLIHKVSRSHSTTHHSP
jgi:hypothetical protein